jgi:hypothetical protein
LRSGDRVNSEATHWSFGTFLMSLVC